MNGILLVNKESGITSRDVVNKVCKIFNTKKVGHTGTLDPLASGVLVLCMGSATKVVEILTSNDKEYEAEMLLGISTDTYDITGKVLKEEEVFVSEEQIKTALNSMIGTYEQEVPIYSAVKINGKKLYDYARNNEEINLPSRSVTIKNISLLNISDNNRRITFKVQVSKGTYIRSLICDIAKKLNTVGTMTKLTRTRQGNFSLDECYTLTQIEQGDYKLLDINTCLNDFFKVIVTGNLERAVKNGAVITNRWQRGKVLFTDEHSNLIALYKKYEKDDKMLKPWKMF